jgi:hypothetical protein
MDTSHMRHLDRGSILVIVITLALFVAALFTIGFKHDLLLEAGVFLVSVKLIIMAYKHSITNQELLRRLEELRADIARHEQNCEPRIPNASNQAAQRTADRPDA